MNYYISDLHLFHKNVTNEGSNFDNRPFDTLEEMHKVIKENWNSKVTNADHVYILGDLAWKENEDKLEEYFRNTKQDEYDGYRTLVGLLFVIVVNPELDDLDNNKFDTKNILKIDDGDYQGTEIFILHKNVYQPDIEDYVYTNTYYGSCSGCDTLLGISGCSDELPSESQVNDYMDLCLHLLQKCHYMIDKEG